MKWILLDETRDGTTRLVAVSLEGGAEKVLYSCSSNRPANPCVDARSQHIAFELQHESGPRLAFANLDQPGTGWLPRSLEANWVLRRAMVALLPFPVRRAI